MAAKSWEYMYKLHHIAGLLLVALVAATLYLVHGTKLKAVNLQVTSKEERIPRKTYVTSTSRCDYFSGRWVYDNVTYPLYNGSQCSFIEDSFACERNGRAELKFQNWRWQPHQCDIPRFNGTMLLEKVRDKKLIFVGDSVGRNQYQSLLCLLESSLPASTRKSVTLTGNMYEFQVEVSVQDFNATIAFYWSPFLVESSCDNATHHNRIKHMIRFEAIENHARFWTDADILIFNIHAWWMDPNLTLLWGDFRNFDVISRRVKMSSRPLQLALQTWSDWLEINMNRTRTKLFFMAPSPIHSLSDLWGASTGDCVGETNLIVDEKVRWKDLEDRSFTKILESTFYDLETRGVKVNYLNITHLSAYRKEAHPSLHASVEHPQRTPDCLHWCLPGVPDVWNAILYAYIIE